MRNSCNFDFVTAAESTSFELDDERLDPLNGLFVEFVLPIVMIRFVLSERCSGDDNKKMTSKTIQGDKDAVVQVRARFGCKCFFFLI